jgi:hemolysin activation/secretion protein
MNSLIPLSRPFWLSACRWLLIGGAGLLLLEVKTEAIDPVPGAGAASPEINRLRYPVSRLHVEYAPTVAGLERALPPVAQITQFSLPLGETPQGLAAPDRPGAHSVSIAPMGKGRRVYCGDGLLAVSNRLVQELNHHGIYGVYVLPAASQIDSTTGEDKRAHKTDLTLQIYVSVVKTVRTVGQRVPLNDADQPVIDSLSHARILKYSPIAPAADTDADRSLLREGLLQDYLNRINRYPGRRVDASVNASDTPGQVDLDYRVREQKPWLLFAQTANTGTESTGEWRTRVGFEEREFLHLDDTLHIDYTTSDFSGYQSASFSYDFAPIFPDYLKVRTYFNWGKYSAADIGVQLTQFEGQTFTSGSSVTWTPLYIHNFPLDITAGVEWQNLSTSNDTDFGGGLPTIGESGSTNFLLPFVSVATERSTDKYTFSANLEFQTNLSGLAHTDSGDDLAALGRPDVDRDFYIGKLNLLYSVYLEPLIFGKDWDDQKVWWKATRAHELYLSFRGQETLGDARLVPQLQFVGGGFNSVRGYPESFAVGDSGFVSTVEYRFHLPRVFRPLDQDADPKSMKPVKKKFSLIPEQIGAAPDWDLIFRAFFDAGQLHNNRATSLSEEDRTLLSAGVGVEFQLLKPLFVSVRADWGFALRSETEDVNEPVRAGSSRVNLAVSLSF